MSDNVTVIVETGQAVVTVSEETTAVATVTLRESVVTVMPTEVHVTIDEHEAHLVDVVETVALVDVTSPSISVEVEERNATVVDVVAAGPPGARGEPGEDGEDGTDGADGADGDDGWTALLAVVEDGERRVLQVVGWDGGTGDMPGTGMYLGPDGYVIYIADATDIRGSIGLQGNPGEQGDPGLPGADGTEGWTPVLATVQDGERRVLQVVGWDGGEGEMPATGMYLGLAGFTIYIEDAEDVRGASGAGAGDKGWSPLLAVVPDGKRGGR